MAEPVIIVHGGCGTVDQSSIPERLEGVKEAAGAGWRILSSGGSSVDAVEAAVVVLENNPLFNAGTGSVLNRAGQVETDAAIMDGSTLAVGAVAAVTGILNPIRLAKRVLQDSPHILLVAKGAEDFALNCGMEKCDPGELVTRRRRRQWEDVHGTVGASAFDSSRRLAAATSTGGGFDKLPGRVGDSPLVGCGTYANRDVAISCTGHGELIARMTLARLAAFLYAELGDAQKSCDAALAQFGASFHGEVGMILIDRLGQAVSAKNTRNMPVCTITERGVLVSC